MATITQHIESAVFDVSPERFVSHLEESAVSYFPDLVGADASVRVAAHSIRQQSQLLQLELTGRNTQKVIIYKIPFCLQRVTTNGRIHPNRPRLYPEAEQTSNGLREFLALQSIEDHFRNLNDSRFDVIPILDLLSDPFVVVMEKADKPCLKSLLKNATRIHPKTQSAALCPALENAGAWLREFHAMPQLEHTESRHEFREDFIAAVQRLTTIPSGHPAHPFQTEDLGIQLIQLAEKHLPDAIPRAVIHGDFAPRNILVSEHNTITVFDTQRRWLAPFYEDLAYFLLSLKASSPQVRSQGLIFSQAQLTSWEDAFLLGYFGGQRPPREILRLYECLLLLEWWGANLHRRYGGGLRQRLNLHLDHRFLRTHFARLTHGLG